MIHSRTALAFVLLAVCLPGLARAATAATAPPVKAPAAPAAKPVPPAPPAAGGENTLKDRVVAIVDEDPILASDIDRVIGLGLAERRPDEAEPAFKKRVLGQLIDQRLRFHEIDRFGFVQQPVAQVDLHVKEIRDRFKTEAEFQKRLKEVGLSSAGLRQLVSRQLMVLTYVDERLGAKVFVGIEDINAYFRDTLVPELKKRNPPVPVPAAIDDALREQIREVLKQKRLNEELDLWTAELRKKADILNYFDDQGKPLPPVVKRIGKKPGG